MRVRFFVVEDGEEREVCEEEFLKFLVEKLLGAEEGGEGEDKEG